MIIETTLGLSNPHREPCTVCGEETAEGSPFFFDRHVVDDPEAGRTFVCSSCVLQGRRKRGRRMDADDTSRIAASALATGVGVLSHG